MLSSKVRDLTDKHGIELKDRDLLCCVSGGADSMALLGYFFLNRDELGLRSVCACHLNHGLRGDESDSDEELVRDFCSGRGISLVTEKLSFDPQQAPSEDGFRELRYAFFERAAEALGADLIATGHTLSDNAETLLFRLARGTGFRGAAGIPAVRDRYIRPLLYCSREETEEYCRQNGIPFCIDSSNQTDRYSRNVIRHHVMPALETVSSGSLEALERFSLLCGEADSYFSGEAERLVLTGEEGEHVPLDVLLDAPAPLNRYIVSRLIRPYVADLSSGMIDRCLYAAASGSRTEICPGIFFECSGGDCRASKRYLRSTVEPSLVLDRIRDDGTGQFVLEDVSLNGRIPDDLFSSCVDYDKLIGVVSVRNRRDGDSFRSARRGVTKTLKKLFNERGYSAEKRDRLLILTDDSGIVWIEGEGPAKGKEIGPGTRKVIRFNTL